jgi:transcriptional regulator GlxA family with amidase domain
MTARSADAGPDREARQFCFVLTPRFTMGPFAAAVEALRLANRQSRRTLYRWRLISADGEPVAASNGVQVMVDGPFAEVERDATVIVCAGLDPQAAATRGLLNWLRRQARLGGRMGALCSGAHMLAAAGLLDGRRCTIHWDNRAGFEEAFPDIVVTNHLFEIDRDRLTCAGGAASSDMMIALIAQEHGPELAQSVADQLLMAPMRGAVEEQRLSAPTRLGTRHPKLVAIIRQMERNLEEPISPPTLAADAGISTRQLERLFRRYLNKSPKRYYMELRLQRARSLLMQTDMSVIAVALASGFTSPSHFSKCYRAQYGRTPYRERGVEAEA